MELYFTESVCQKTGQVCDNYYTETPFYNNIDKITFIGGLAVIKDGRKIISKIYDRKVFYHINKIPSTFSKPYSITINNLIKECDNLSECIESLIKFYNY